MLASAKNAVSLGPTSRLVDTTASSASTASGQTRCAMHSSASVRRDGTCCGATARTRRIASMAMVRSRRSSRATRAISEPRSTMASGDRAAPIASRNALTRRSPCRSSRSTVARRPAAAMESGSACSARSSIAAALARRSAVGPRRASRSFPSSTSAPSTRYRARRRGSVASSASVVAAASAASPSCSFAARRATPVAAAGERSSRRRASRYRLSASRASSSPVSESGWSVAEASSRSASRSCSARRVSSSEANATSARSAPNALLRARGSPCRAFGRSLRRRASSADGSVGSRSRIRAYVPVGSLEGSLHSSRKARFQRAPRRAREDRAALRPRSVSTRASGAASLDRLRIDSRVRIAGTLSRRATSALSRSAVARAVSWPISTSRAARSKVNACAADGAPRARSALR